MPAAIGQTDAEGHHRIEQVRFSWEDLYKETGVDTLQEKATYPKLLGLKESKNRIKELTERAEEALLLFGAKAEPLKQTAQYLCMRTQ